MEQPPRSIIPLQIAFFALISNINAPLYVHSYTGKEDELRYHHLSHASLDVVEQRENMPNRQPENYLGLLFTMDDLAIYGYRTTTGLRIIVGLALIDGIIKDSDVVVIFRAIHSLYASTTSNPFLPLNQQIDYQPQSLPYKSYETSTRLRIGADRLGALLNGGRN